MTKPVIGSTCFLLEHKTLALVPAPGFFVLAHAAQVDFVGQQLAGEGEQLPAEVLALIFRGDEQLVEIEFGQMQRQHRRDRAAIVGDEQAPALLDLERNARAQFRQQEIAGILEPGGSPAVHPDAGDLVIFVCPGGTDRSAAASNGSCASPRANKKKPPRYYREGFFDFNRKRKFIPLARVAAIRPDRSDPRSSPWSTPPRSPSQTSPWRRRCHRLPRWRAAASANRRSGRRACRST